MSDTCAEPWGEHHHDAKLNATAVKAIRTSADSMRTLAARYGVTVATIWNAKHGFTWKHVH